MGRWFTDARRSRGELCGMNRHGWPVGVSDQAAGDDCGQLWRSLLAMAPEIDGDEVQVTPLRLAPGCEFRLGMDLTTVLPMVW